jgi:nitrite reductase/ring-hydroxylating ferredoxin subunit
MSEWVDAGSVEDLRTRGRRVFKAAGRQVLLVSRGDRIFACNNRCPHEGYPLSEGTLSDWCTLTCNWHNWKFNLESGETLVGGDRLVLYPVEVREGRVFVDVTQPPADELQLRALANLDEAVADNDYERMAREVARYLKAGGDTLEPLRRTMAGRADRFEYGMTHAFAAAPGWIALREQAGDEARRLAALVEPIAHIAWDTLREDAFPFAEGHRAWEPQVFVRAIEDETEALAVALVRGALKSKVPLDELRRAFATAALAHYQDFGHSAIYVLKAFELIGKLGAGVAEPVLLSLVRSLVFASREDLIPEFRSYAGSLARHGQGPRESWQPQDLVGLPVPMTLARVSGMVGTPQEKYATLLEASAIAMLRFDMAVDQHVGKPVSHNVRWLDFTHMLTFGNAVRQLCDADPALWPQGLLQMGCFLGRNAPFLLPAVDEGWFVKDEIAFITESRGTLYDHGIREPIYACHRVKMIEAVEEEIRAASSSRLKALLAAALNRYLSNGIKNHHVLRVAAQSLAFVDAEG